MGSSQLVVRNGDVVIGGAATRVDIGIDAGRIVQIGGEMAGEQEIDADGLLVLPGAIDPHVHLTLPNPPSKGPAWVDDFTSGTAAALAGGITTVGNMTFLRHGETPLEGLEREAALVREQALTNVFLHPVLSDISAKVLDQIPALLDHGCNTIKYFMSMPIFDPQVQGFLDATALAGQNGLLTMIHCEDYAIIEYATRRLMSSGRGSLRYYAESRPVVSEVVSVERAVAFSRITGAPVYIVHLSSKEAMEVCQRAQADGVQVYVETRPLYLHLTRERFEEPDGAKYVGQPPLRDQEDVDALWVAIRRGSLHVLGTDHAPWSLKAKLDPKLSVANPRGGVENLETQLPMLYSEGVLTERISLTRFVEVVSTNPAKLFGLYPRKGCIAVGSDADLVLFDPTVTYTIGKPRHSRCDYSAFEGRHVTGCPVMTLSHGRVVYQRGEVTAVPGSADIAERDRTMPI